MGNYSQKVVIIAFTNKQGQKQLPLAPLSKDKAKSTWQEEFPIKRRCLVFDRVIECLEEQADMKIHFLLCGSGRPIFVNSRRHRMEDRQEQENECGVDKVLNWILGTITSQEAVMSTQSCLAKMSRGQDMWLLKSF